MDITPALSAILVQSHSAKAISQETKRLTQTLDAFLKEAYQIVRIITTSTKPS